MADSKSGPPAFEIHYVLREFRPEMDSPGYNDEDDMVWVTSLGDPFMYVIPSFDIIALELRRMKIRGYGRSGGKERSLGLFVRNDASLCQMYPSMMVIKDVTIIKVCTELMQHII